MKSTASSATELREGPVSSYHTQKAFTSVEPEAGINSKALSQCNTILGQEVSITDIIEVSIIKTKCFGILY